MCNFIKVHKITLQTHNILTRWRDYSCPLWQTLTVCCISNTFTYGLRLLPSSMQKVSFYRVKDGLSQDEKPCLAG